MWPYMGSMGWWMPLVWLVGLALLATVVWMIGRAAGGVPGRADDTPEQVLKRRYARGEIEREEYLRRLDDLRH